MISKKNIALMLLIFAVSISGTTAQQPAKGMEIDGVAALVGDMMIMESDIKGQLMVMASRDPNLNIEDPELRKEILDDLIDRKLLVAKAVEDSMIVSPSQVEQNWNYWLEDVVSRYGSEKRLEQMYGMTISELKSKISEQIKNEQLRSMAINAKFGNLKVTKNEVESYYKKNKDSMPTIPFSIDVYHIVKEVKVKESVLEDVEALALRVRDSILSGGDFAAFAKQYSDDKYSRPEGGNLGWFDKKKLFPEFVSAATKLQEGEVSMPIETPLGIHLIQTISKESDRLNTRHILFKIGKTQKDNDAVTDFLAELKDSVVNHGVDFETLAKRHSDEIDTKGFGGSLGLLPVSEFPPNIQNILNEMEEGEVSQPLKYEEDSYHIIYKKRTVEAHKANLEDDYKTIESRALFEKKNQMLEDWVKELRKELYWEYAGE